MRAALADHGTFRAHRLGILLTSFSRESTLPIGVEEHRWILMSAARRELPRPRFGKAGTHWLRRVEVLGGKDFVQPPTADDRRDGASQVSVRRALHGRDNTVCVRVSRPGETGLLHAASVSVYARLPDSSP